MKYIYLFLFCIISLTVSAQWKYADFPDGGDVFHLTYHNNTVYAGSPWGLFISRDNGKNWTEIKSISRYDINCFTTVGNTVFAGTYEGIYKTTDNGNSWTTIDTKGLTNHNITSLAIKDASIFALTNYGQIFLSTDNGANWEKISKNIPALENFMSIAVSGSNILAGTYYSSLYLSADDGKTWLRTDSVNKVSIIARSIVSNAHTTFAGGSNTIFSSPDNGTTWSQLISYPNAKIHSIVTNGDTICVSSENGMYFSADNGNNWELFNKGLPLDSSIYSVAINHTFFYAATRNGTYGLDLKNKEWKPMVKGLTNINVASLSNIGKNIYAGTFGHGTFLSVNSGNSWLNITNGVPDDAVVLKVINTGLNLYMGTYNHGVLLSTDNGNSWVKKNNNLPTDIYSIAFINNKLYAGTFLDGLFVSVDNGDHWEPVNTIAASNLTIYSIEHDGKYLYAGTSSGFIRSADNGINWELSNAGLPSSLWSFKINNNRLIAGLYEGIFISDDKGDSWVQMTNGLPNDAIIRDLAVKENNIFAATIKGIFLSRDNGTKWQSINENLDRIQIQAVNIQNDSLFISVAGAGVWVRPLEEVLPGIKEYVSSLLFRLYPNPGTGIFMLELVNEKATHLEVINTIGELIFTTDLTSSNYQLDLRNSAKGIYSVNIRSEKGKWATKKIVIQ